MFSSSPAAPLAARVASAGEERMTGQVSPTPRRLNIKIPQLKLGGLPRTFRTVSAVGGLFRASLQRGAPPTSRFSSNPTHGSGWMLQIRPTNQSSPPLCVIYLSPLALRGREVKPGIPGAHLCRLALNNPPTAVGGIPGTFRAVSDEVGMKKYEGAPGGLVGRNITHPPLTRRVYARI